MGNKEFQEQIPRALLGDSEPSYAYFVDVILESLCTFNKRLQEIRGFSPVFISYLTIILLHLLFAYNEGLVSLNTFLETNML